MNHPTVLSNIIPSQFTYLSLPFVIIASRTVGFSPHLREEAASTREFRVEIGYNYVGG